MSYDLSWEISLLSLLTDNVNLAWVDINLALRVYKNDAADVYFVDGAPSLTCDESENPCYLLLTATSPVVTMCSTLTNSFDPEEVLQCQEGKPDEFKG